jgi:hypothetical protein
MLLTSLDQTQMFSFRLDFRLSRRIIKRMCGTEHHYYLFCILNRLLLLLAFPIPPPAAVAALPSPRVATRVTNLNFFSF